MNQLKAFQKSTFTKKKSDAVRLARVQRNRFFFELLPNNIINNSKVYCHQLDKLKYTFKQRMSELTNRKGKVFHRDYARPHTSLLTHQKLSQFEWYILQPDLAPSKFPIVPIYMQNFLDRKTFLSNENIKSVFF